MGNTIRRLGIIFGGFIVVNILIEKMILSSMVNFVIYISIGLVILLYSLFYTQIKDYCKKPILKTINTIVKTGIIFFVISFTLLSTLIFSNSLKTPNEPADAVIVLGAGLKGDKVSFPLASRLDTAAEYYATNPDALIIVSGGQGPNETVTEAYAMKKYLMNLGVPKDQIIEEGLSTRTIENFQFSKEILDHFFAGEQYSVVYVTNNTHVFRAGLISNQVGLNTQSVGAENKHFLAVNQYIYEYFALIKYFVIDYK